MGTTSRNSSPPTQVQSSSSSATLDNNMSNNNKLNNSGSTITTAKSSIYTASNETTIDLNDLRLSDHTQHTDNSFGNSSLSSFLSVLFEDEESSEFLIVQDNPKVPASEQRSIRNIRVAFSSNATELNDDSNHKTKSRWDYLVREHSDNDLLYTSSRRSRRAEHQIRSSSFSDAIPSTMVKMSELRRSARSYGCYDSATVSPGDNSTKGNSNSNMFLRMPRRQRSPTEDEIGKKSLYDRLNQSDSALLDTRLPMPSRPPRRDSRNINYYSSGRGYGERRLKRSGTHEKSNANASWSKTGLRARRNEEHNRFFDIMMEPDGDAAAGRASPSTNSLSTLQSSSSSAFHESMSMLNNNSSNNDSNSNNISIGELLISLSDNDDDNDNDNDNILQSLAFQESMSMSMLNNNNNNNNTIGELLISLSDNDNDVDNDNDNSLLSSSSSAFQESTLIHNDSMKDLTSLLMSTKKAHHKKKKKSSSSSPPPEIDNHE